MGGPIQRQNSLARRRSLNGERDAFSGEGDVPAALEDVDAVAISFGIVVALRRDGTLTKWGNSRYSKANFAADLTNVVAIAVEYSTLTNEQDTKLHHGEYHLNPVNREVTQIQKLVYEGFHTLLSDPTISSWPII